MSDKPRERSGLVVSAHSADFIWRAGGAISLHAKRGWKVKVVCLSFGEKGESQKLWKDPAMTLDRVKKERQAEAERAGAILGAAEMEFFDLGDYPMRTSVESLERLADIFSLSVRTGTHPFARRSLQLRPPRGHAIRAGSAGRSAGPRSQRRRGGDCRPSRSFSSSPISREQCNWKPQVILDITEVWETKRKAFEAMNAQEHLWEYRGPRSSGANTTRHKPACR